MSVEAQEKASVILLISCPDRMGIVAAVTSFIRARNGNVINLEQHVDPREGHFFMRIEWHLEDFETPLAQFKKRFSEAIATDFEMDWSLHLSAERPRMAVFVSKYSHCLFDILSRYQAGEWQVEIPFIMSNHRDLESAAKNVGIDFHHVPMTKDIKAAQEGKILELLKQYDVEFVVLARYMQILSDDFVRHYPQGIINIHHSFLPAFPGAKAYHAAYERGVKIIGVTSHYATAELDAGPIITQDVVPVKHTDGIDDFLRKGRDLEKVVLSRAIWQHLKRKVLVHKNKTILFS